VDIPRSAISELGFATPFVNSMDDRSPERDATCHSSRRLSNALTAWNGNDAPNKNVNDANATTVAGVGDDDDFITYLLFRTILGAVVSRRLALSKGRAQGNKCRSSL
jgi:hypothetical protein